MALCNLLEHGSDDAKINVAFGNVLEHGSNNVKINVVFCNVLEHGSDEAEINVACCNVPEHCSDDVNRQSIKENKSQGITIDDVKRRSIKIKEDESQGITIRAPCEMASPQTRLLIADGSIITKPFSQMGGTGVARAEYDKAKFQI